jgi:hypothetical protein
MYFEIAKSKFFFSFYKEKSLVGLTPGLVEHTCLCDDVIQFLLIFYNRQLSVERFADGVGLLEGGGQFGHGEVPSGRPLRPIGRTLAIEV